MIPVFYRPEMIAANSSSFSPSAGKPKAVVEDWLATPEIASRIEIATFNKASDEVLTAVHDPDYVAGVLSCELENGFGNTSPEVAASLRWTVGSIVAAAKHAITDRDGASRGVAVSPTSGFHHAGYNYGGGFCTFNGLMAAAYRVHALGMAKRILVLDMDQHFGDGTESIIKRRRMSFIDHVTATKSYSTAAEALRRCNLGQHPAIRASRNRQPGAPEPYDLVIYQAGADMHVNDPLGGLMDAAEMRLRDRNVFRGCLTWNVPIVWCLAGGYQRDLNGSIAPVIELHRNTMMECIDQWLQ